MALNQPLLSGQSHECPVPLCMDIGSDHLVVRDFGSGFSPSSGMVFVIRQVACLLSPAGHAHRTEEMAHRTEVMVLRPSG